MLEQNRAELEKSGALWWHDRGYKGKGVTVAVIDKGCPRENQKDYVEFPIAYTEKVDHGSNVCAVVHAVAPEAKIVLLPHNSSSIQYILDNNIKLVNSSVGARNPCAFFEPLKDRALVFGASGNGFEEDGAYYPGAYPWNISVGAYVESIDNPASYSNGGVELDIVSYTNIAVETDKGTIFEFNGTSAASPFACGLMALVRGACLETGWDMTPAEMQQYVFNNTVDVYKEGTDYKTGRGLFVLGSLPKKVILTLDEKTYTVNGEEKELDIPMTSIQGRTMIPLRAVGDALGANVEWDNLTKKATITLL